MEDDNRPYITVKVKNHSFLGLLDSGATKTFVGSKGWKFLQNLDFKMVPTEKVKVAVADGRRLNVSGFVQVPFMINHKEVVLDVQVFPELMYGLVLGVDFWKESGILPNMKRGVYELVSLKQTGQIGLEEGASGLRDATHLTEKQNNCLQRLKEKYFGGEDNSQRLGYTNLVEHVIDTGDAEPIKQRYYPVSPVIQEVINQELNKMLKLGIVIPSKSPWSSPIVLVEKNDGSRRFCIDFRRVNTVTKKDAYPLPYVTSILDQLRDARFLSSIDLKSAYWQIPLEKASQEKTAFAVPGRGLFHFVRMPFGLHNAPATWQRFIDRVLGPELSPFVFVYLDDIIVCTQTFDKHIEMLEEVFKRLIDSGLTLNGEKTELCKKQLRYLGYLVDNQGLKVDPDKVEAILKIPTPTCVRDVRRFCGMASWYRRFISDFSSITEPLTSLLKKRKKWEWPVKAQVAFDTLKKRLTEAPILTCPDFSKPFVIQTDASNVGLGAVLLQLDSNEERVIAYASRSLNQAEKNYSTTERECLAVVFAVEKFRPYVDGYNFKIITDHYSLIWLYSLKEPKGRLARWIMKLQSYNFEITHRPGKENLLADSLSRFPGLVGSLYAPINSTDEWYQKMLKEITNNPENYPDWKVEKQQIFKNLMEFSSNSFNSSWKKVVPRDDRLKVFEECHLSPTAGHFGVSKTFLRAAETYYWPRMRRDLARLVRSCKTCQACKVEQKLPAGLMGAGRKVEEPWAMISADVIGPLPRSSKGNKYLLVVTDSFTKFVLLFPLRAVTSALVADRLENHVFMIFGVPEIIISDNGPEFKGAKYQKLCREYGIRLFLNARYHPQANPTERMNRTIIGMIRSYIQDNQKVWDVCIAQLGFAIRTAVNDSTGYSPSFLNFGRNPRPRINDLRGRQFEDSSNPPEIDTSGSYINRLQQLNLLREDVRERLKEEYKNSAQRYNLRRRHVAFEVGDRVWKRNFKQSNAAANYNAKLDHRYVGPYNIGRKVTETVYDLLNSDGRDCGRWHVSDLKPYVE